MNEKGSGPFRDEDPVVKLGKRVDDVAARLERLAVTEHEGHARLRSDIDKLRRDRVGSLAPWLGTPLLTAAALYGLSLLVGTCSQDCRASSAAEAREFVTNCQTQCTAMGMRNAGHAAIATPGYAASDRCVCGNGHGDGMYIGVDGHLHAVKVHAPPPPDDESLGACLNACNDRMQSWSATAGCRCKD